MKATRYLSLGLSAKLEPGEHNKKTLCLLSWPSPAVPPLAGPRAPDHLLCLSCILNFYLCSKNGTAYSA